MGPLYTPPPFLRSNPPPVGGFNFWDSDCRRATRNSRRRWQTPNSAAELAAKAPEWAVPGFSRFAVGPLRRLARVKKPGCLLGAEFVLSARTNRLRSLQSSGAHQLIQNYCGRGPRLFTLASLHQSTSGSDLRQEQAQDADHLGFAPEMVTVLTTASLLPWPHQSEAAPLIVCRAGRVLRSNVLMQPLKCVFGSGEQLKMRPPRSAVDSSAYVGRIRNSPLKSQLPISALLYEIRSPVAY
jgi:hypothetical protein